MKRVLATLVSVAVLACATTLPAEPSGPPSASAAPAVLDLESKTVALVGKDRYGDIAASCSGTWIGPLLILTANHCVDEQALGARVDYLTRGDLNAEDDATRTRSGSILARDEDHDLALIRTRVEDTPAHGVAVIGSDPYAGLPVQTMGHPLGLWYSYSTGVVSAVRHDTGWWVQTTAPVSPGNSGGGLFDLNGRLVGVCHGYLPKGQTLNMFVHVTHVRALVGSI